MILVTDVLSNPVPAVEPEERAALKESMERHGFWPTHPVIHDEDGNVLAGFTRLSVALELGLEPVLALRSGLSEWEKVEFMVEDNTHRRHLSPAQRRQLLKRLVEIHEATLKAAAKEALREGGRKGGAAKARLTEPTLEAGARAAAAEASGDRFDASVVAGPPKATADVRSNLAKMVGVSRATVTRDLAHDNRVEAIEQAAEAAGREDVVRALNQTRPNLEALEREVGLRAPLPVDEPANDRAGWVSNLATALRMLDPAVSADEAAFLIERYGDARHLVIQLRQLTNAVAEAKGK